MTSAFAAWLDRQGGMLVAPRATAAALAPDVGARDATLALVAFFVGCRVPVAVSAMARIVSLGNLDGVMVSVADLALALLAPFLALVAIELVLGKPRSYRAGSCLIAMVTVATLLHGATLVAGYEFDPAWIADVIAGAAGLALAAWIRPVVPEIREAKS